MSLGISLGVDESHGLVQQVPFWVLGKSFGVPASVDLNFATSQYYQTGTNATDPTTYIQTVRNTSAMAPDASGNWTTFAANAPRITSAGLTVETASTNMVLQSNLQSGWGTQNDTLTPAAALGPDGVLSAAKSVPNTNVTMGHGEFSASMTLTAATYAGSAFFKPAGYNFAAITLRSPNGTTGFSAVVNLANGSVTQTSTLGAPAATTTTVVPYANGWTRVIITMTCSATANQSFLLVSPSPTATPSVDASINPTFTGDGTSGILYWGAQVELGTFATTPIATTSTTVPRSADVIKSTTIPTVGASYSVSAYGTPQSPTTNSVNQVLTQVSDGTNSNRGGVIRGSGTGNSGQSPVGTGGTTSAFANNGSISVNPVLAQNTLGKLAVSYTGASGLNTLNIGSRPDGGLQWNGTISRVALWPTTALTGAQMQTITSLP